jgi:hypothetical protein
MLLSNGGVPEEAIEPLEQCLATVEIGTGLFAAAALCRSGRPGANALNLVMAALEGDDDIIAGVAGGLLLAMNVHPEKALPVLQSRLPCLTQHGRYLILLRLKELGPAAMPLYSVVRDIAVDQSGEPGVRREALTALGSMTRGTEKASATLLEALRSQYWQVVHGAIQGFELIGFHPSEGLSVLIDLLNHQADDMRLVAAAGIRGYGKDGAPAIDAIVARFGEEQNQDVCEQLIMAIGSIGGSAVPQLVDIIKTGKVSRVEPAIRALAVVGAEAASAIARLLPTIADVRISESLVSALGIMGKRSLPAIDVLARVLDETLDDSVALHAALGLFVCSPLALPALPSLIRCIAERGSAESEVGLFAERALWALRDHAVPALESALSQYAGSEKRNIEHTLTMLGSWDDGAYAYLEDLDRDDWIAMFIAVGDVLLEEKGSVRTTHLPKLLEQRLRAGKIEWSGFPMGKRTIELNLSSLQTRLGVPLTSLGDYKPIRLTDQGLRVLREAREYMRRKALRAQRRRK